MDTIIRIITPKEKEMREKFPELYKQVDRLNKLIEKIIKKYDLNDKTQYNKMCRYLLGKGFSYGEIQEALFKYTNYDTEW